MNWRCSRPGGKPKHGAVEEKVHTAAQCRKCESGLVSLVPAMSCNIQHSILQQEHIMRYIVESSLPHYALLIAVLWINYHAKGDTINSGPGDPRTQGSSWLCHCLEYASQLGTNRKTFSAYSVIL